MATLETSNPQGESTGVIYNAVGQRPDVSEGSLQSQNRTIGSIDQAFSVCETMVNDWKKGILVSARITAKLNGQKPYNVAKLKSAKKDWKTNISTGFLATECARVVPRFFMPLKTAKYLTASALPPEWPMNAEKTQFFRETITKTIRAWPKFNFYIRGLSREVAVFGFAFNVFFDKYEWRPTLMRMDKGFVPQGTEVVDEPVFFMAKYDYKPSELLQLLRDSIDAGDDHWVKNAVVAAINNAQPPPVDATYPQARSYEELIRQATWGYSYTKGVNLISTWHLFAKETDGSVSHYILLDGSMYPAVNVKSPSKTDNRLLYEYLDKYQTMSDAVNTIVFDYGDGTVHGSWGAGQILYDLAAQVEKVRCDSIDNMRMANKLKLTVPEAKNVADVQLSVNDTMVIASGATFTGNQAAIPENIEGYELLDQKLTKIAQEKIGAFVPPIPLQANDIKAAQVNAALSKEKELQEALLENWLIQFGDLIFNMQKRLCNFDSPDPVAQNTINILRQKLSDSEISMLANTKPLQSVMDFTEYKAQQRAVFAQSVLNNALFRQSVVARTMASGIGDAAFVDEIVVPEGDQSEQEAEARQQIVENAAMYIGQAVPVVPKDNDWVHMQTLKPALQQQIQQENLNVSKIGLDHYTAHYMQGIQKKAIPKDQINTEKSWIASAAKAIEQIAKSKQIQQTAAALQQHAAAAAQEIVAAEQGGAPSV